MSTAKIPPGSYFWITATLIAASAEPIIVKMGYAANLSPWQLLCLKSVVGALVIWPLTRQNHWVGLQGLKLILPPALLLLCTSTLMLLSLQHLQASLLITILTVTPAAVAIVNQALGRDILGFKFWLGFLLSALGLSLTAGTEFGAVHISGIVFAFLAVASSCTYRVLLEKTTKVYKPSLVSTYIFFLHGLLCLPFLPLVCNGAWSSHLLVTGLWLGLIAALANVAFLYAISLLGATRISIITMLQRPIVIALAALILKEALSVYQIAGIVLVIAGVQMAQVKRRIAANDSSQNDASLEKSKTA